MNLEERKKLVSSLVNTSVDDCRISLSHSHCQNTALLCDLLIECHARGEVSREKIVRRVISKFIRKGVRK